MTTLLAGIVLAALVFSALLWSIYRAATQKGALRAVQAFLAISTVMIVAALTWELHALLLSSGLSCALMALVAIWTEPRWNKLLPLIQLIVGVGAVYAGFTLLSNDPLVSGPPLL